jgi:radical SAM protein with 4Fe4S-binding SPASM domain
MESTIESLAAFPPILAEIGVKNYILQGMHDITTSLHQEQLYNQNHTPGHIDRIKRLCEAIGIHLALEYEERQYLELTDPEKARISYHDIDGPFSPEWTRQCTNPWEIPFIDKSGNVFPCCYGDQNSLMGNLNEVSFAKIWNGKRFQEFRDALRGGTALPSICRKCLMAPLGPHPWTRYAARIVPEQSRLHGHQALKLVVQNTGTEAWTRENPIEIRTFQLRSSVYHHFNWLGPNRVCEPVEDIVPPGRIATFWFKATLGTPQETELFQLWINGYWLPETQFEIKPSRHPMDLARALWRVICDWLGITPPQTILLVLRPGLGITSPSSVGSADASAHQPLVYWRRLLLVANPAASLPSVDQALIELAEPR